MGFGKAPTPPPPPPPPPPPASAAETTAESGSASRRTRQKALSRKGIQSTLIAGQSSPSSTSRSGSTLLG